MLPLPPPPPWKRAPFPSLHSCEQQGTGVRLTEVAGTVQVPANGFLGNGTPQQSLALVVGMGVSPTSQQEAQTILWLKFSASKNATILPLKVLQWEPGA